MKTTIYVIVTLYIFALLKLSTCQVHILGPSDLVKEINKFEQANNKGGKIRKLNDYFIFRGAISSRELW